MKTVAVLLDGGFVLWRLYHLLGKRHATAEEVYAFARACATEDEEIFRIYYYDCPPYQETITNPLDPHEVINYGRTGTAIRKMDLQRKLVMKDLVAYRKGDLGFDGWGLSRTAENDLFRNPREVKAQDLKPKFRQKQVDIKIGLDVAWLASKHIVDRIILVTGDSDFVPAMKFARREGTQVIIVPMGHKYVKKALLEHADFVRHVPLPAPLFHTPTQNA